jgi:hypothetical protein
MMSDEVVRLLWAVFVGAAGHWTVNFTVRRYRGEKSSGGLEQLEKELKADHERTRDTMRELFAEAGERERRGREAAVAHLALALDNLGSRVTIQMLETENRRHAR